MAKVFSAFAAIVIALRKHEFAVSGLKTGVLAEPVLVGREKELEELQHYLERVFEGKGNTVFISGEAGSGKTRLIREFLNTARKQGAAVMAGWCLSDAQVPFFPFIEAFNTYYAAFPQEEESIGFQQSSTQLNLRAPAQVGIEEREITQWLAGPKPAEKLGKPEVLSPQVWKDQALDAVAKTMHLIATHGPVVLFLEDVHWADSASLTLLHYLSRTIKDSERVLVLATFRSEELTADAEGHPHPLAETLRLMSREELFKEIKLPNLNRNFVSRIAENMVGGTLNSELAEKLAAESKGNPLFVVESIRMLSERGSLVKEKDEWHLAVGEMEIPSKIKNIILRRLACLNYTQRQVLDAASVIGEEFDVELLSSVLGQDILDVLQTLNMIARSTSLVCVEENRYRFDHARSKETLYEEISAPLKRGYHNRIAERLENTKKSALPLSDLAFHYAQAGNTRKAVVFALLAGRDDLAKFSNAQAIKHFQYVLQNVSDGYAEEKRAALDGLGDAYSASSMFGEAIKTFDKLAAIETGLGKLRAFRKASDTAYAQGDQPDLLVEYAKKAQELGVKDRLEMARIIDNRGHAWAWSGRGTPEMDLADYDAALQVFEEENSLADVAEALNRSGAVCSAFIDNLREKGICELLRSAAILREIGDIRNEANSTYWLANGFRMVGLSPEDIRTYALFFKKSENLGLFTQMAVASFHLSHLALIEGNVEEALTQGLKEWAYANKTDSNVRLATSSAHLTLVCSLLGDIKQADAYYDKFSNMPQEFLVNPVHMAPFALGVYFAAKFRWEESEENFKIMLKFYETLSWTGAEYYVRKYYAWALKRQGRFEEANAEQEKSQKLLEAQEQKIESRFGHARIQLNLLMQRRVKVAEEFEMRLDLTNAGRKPGTLVKLEGLGLQEFRFSSLPSYCNLQENSLAIRDKSVRSFEVETMKLRLSATKPGSFNLNPEIFYVDDLGSTITFKTTPVTITVEPAKPAYEILPGRVTTGTNELDRLLLGGIPEKYAVVLAATSSDDEQQIVNRFLKNGPEKGEISVYLTCEASRAEELAKNSLTNFYVCICNPQADTPVPNLQNIIRLKGTENLTDIDIALTKLFRVVNQFQPNPKRFCVDLLSDVLLQHHAVITRKWLSSVLTKLKAKGFTTLAVLDPQMHPAEESRAIMRLFDGEIRVAEKETANGTVKALKVTKLQGQDYLKEEVPIHV